MRTYPVRANRLVFFVIGDYGVGGGKEKGVADAMWNEFQRRAAGGDPVRFVITVGDNIYANVNLGYLQRGSGDQDRDWDNKFFQPYRELLRQIPFYPSLGNHDGNSSENRGDLAAYLDNFFFPENRPARWYEFSFGGLADFFALDSTENSTASHTAPVFGPESEQFRWMEKAMPESKAPWKIPYFHHPPFTAGPAHSASYGVLRHWHDLFQKTGVKVVFTGHEHNLQFSENSDATGHIQYVVTGAGGELRIGKRDLEHGAGAHPGLGGGAALPGGGDRRQGDEDLAGGEREAGREGPHRQGNADAGGGESGMTGARCAMPVAAFRAVIARVHNPGACRRAQ